jgi:hypothetical protein
MQKKIQMPRVVVPPMDDDAEGWRYARAYADKIASDPSFGVKEIVVYVATKQQLKNSDFPRIAGARLAKALHDGDSVKLANGLTMRAETMKTLRYSGRGALILGFWVDDKMMAAIDGMDGVSAVVAYPWPENGLENWIKTWNPKVHGQLAQPAPPLLTDPIVEAALKSLTTGMNLSHTGLHTHYAESAERTLRILRAKKHILDADNIRLWAVQNGWQPGAADDLQKKARKVADLKTKPSINAFEGGERTYDYWVAKSKGETP